MLAGGRLESCEANGAMAAKKQGMLLPVQIDEIQDHATASNTTANNNNQNLHHGMTSTAHSVGMSPGGNQNSLSMQRKRQHSEALMFEN